MTTTTNIIISFIILLILIIYNIYISKKHNQSLKLELYKKIKKIKIILYLVSIIIFILFLITNLLPLGTSPTNKEIITCIINALSVSLLALPLSLETLYITTFTNEEKYTYIKTIITTIYNKEYITKLNKAGINVILLSNKKTDLKEIKLEKITSNNLEETIQIKTDDLKILDKKINKIITTKETKSLENIYNKISNARYINDNYIKTFKYLLVTYTPLVLSYFFLDIMSFPVTYNILLTMILKLYTTLISRILYKHLPYDKELMNRTVKPNNIIMGTQEVLLTIIECFISFFFISLPYMYVLAKGTGILFGNTIYFVTFILTNIFLSYYYLNDSSFIFNIIRNIKNIRFHIFTIISIIFIIFINNNNYFLTRNITLYNNIGCLIISVVCVLSLEIIKLTRFISSKGKNKNANKNNKKSRRSKSNNS